MVVATDESRLLLLLDDVAQLNQSSSNPNWMLLRILFVETRDLKDGGIPLLRPQKALKDLSDIRRALFGSGVAYSIHRIFPIMMSFTSW